MAAERDEKTEAPTPRRRQEARAKGQIARSQDLTAAVLLFAGFATLRIIWPPLWQSLQAIVATALSAPEPTRLESLLPFSLAIGREMIYRMGPYLLVLLAVGFMVLYAQVGPLLTVQPITPSLNKINPLNGIKRLFSLRSVMMTVLNMGKLVVVGGVAYLVVSSEVGAILFASGFAFHDLLRLGGTLLFELCMQLSIAVLILALIDLVWQRYRHGRDLRMTKDEVKDEMRSMEGDPKMKQRRRQVQMQLAMQRLQKDVPQADVIVTNPTHISIAIAYDAKKMVAPKVVAKGADEIALRIRQIAQQHGIPIVEKKPLARALFQAVDVGDFIPERFYRAIAEILAYIYELTGSGPDRSRPELVGA
jgi:flagellar biosynthesis protein FlhB